MSSAQPVLPEKPKSKVPVVPLVIGAVLIALLAVGAWLLGRGDDEAATATAPASDAEGATDYRDEVTIGVADSSLDYWRTYTDLARSELGVEVELVNFSDYSLPNPALSEEETDLNQFQHIQYLANYNTTADDDLQPIGATAIYPLPLYSSTVDDPADLPEGAVVAIPNDEINQARALLVLQSAGLVELADGGSAYADTDDITSSRVEVTPIDASQTAGAVQSGSAAAAVVNVNFATSAGLPADDIIAQDDPADPGAAPYVNIFASRSADVDDPTYLALAELWHDPRVQELFAADYPNAVVVEKPADELQADLAAVEQDAAAAAG